MYQFPGQRMRGVDMDPGLLLPGSSGLAKTARRVPAPIADELKQGLRLRRFLLASAFSLLYLAVHGSVLLRRSRSIRERCSRRTRSSSAFIIVFFVLFGLKLNLRFPDPSLTGLADDDSGRHDALRRLLALPDTGSLYTPCFRRVDVRDVASHAT
jgi:hypothetical protein